MLQQQQECLFCLSPCRSPKHPGERYTGRTQCKVLDTLEVSLTQCDSVTCLASLA
jgi:hypothetical protein